MKNKVTKLHMQFLKVKSMTGFCNVKVFEVHSVPESCVQLQINGEPFLKVPTLYDSGLDGTAQTQTLDDGVDLYTLKSKIISVQTVSGTEKKDFTRRKLKIRTHQGFIRRLVALDKLIKISANQRLYTHIKYQTNK